MTDLKNFDPFAMIEPKTPADRHLVLRELQNEVEILIEHFEALTSELVVLES